jgi:mRNA interferase HigB
MRIIKQSTLKTFYDKHRDAESWLKGWLVVAKAAQWKSLDDVRKSYKNADPATVASGSTVTIFNVRGDNYRFVVSIHYNARCIYIRDFMTHEEYNSQLWKNRH